MFGVDDLLIMALVTSIASAGMQYKASTDASRRSTNETQRALARQAEYQKMAEARALEQVQKYNTEDRMEKQQELAEQLTETFYKPVEAMQTVNSLGATTQGKVSSDYLAAKSSSDANQLKMAKELASLFGKQAGASRLRQEESIGMVDAVSDIGRFGSFANGQAGADQFAINNAGQPNAELGLAGSILGSIGSVAGAVAVNKKPKG